MSTTVDKKKFCTFSGHELFRHRVVCSVLSGKPLRIENIRADDAAPGVQDHEASFLELVQMLTNGTKVDISATGTTVRVRPGVLVGGGPHTHHCRGSRGIGWFLEGITLLAPFARERTILTLTGITNEQRDASVDCIRTVTLPLLRHLGVDEGVELRIKKRGAAPDGGGEVFFTCDVVRAVKPINLTEEGKIKRIRGIVFSARVSPQIGNRVVESARSLLNQFLPDVYIYTDHYKGAESGLSPGYGVCLVAESTTGVLLSAEVTATKGDSPEDVGLDVAKLLCEQISLGGCVDTTNQITPLLFMAMAPEDVSRVRLGRLSEHTVGFLRLLRDALSVKFLIKEQDDGTVMLSCLGIGFSNVAKPTS